MFVDTPDWLLTLVVVSILVIGRYLSIMLCYQSRSFRLDQTENGVCVVMRNFWDIGEIILVRNTGDLLKWKFKKNSQTFFWKRMITKKISDWCVAFDSVPKFRNLTELFWRNFTVFFVPPKFDGNEIILNRGTKFRI